MNLQQTTGRGYQLLSLYKEKNADIPEPIRSQMAIFHIAPTIRKKALHELYDYKFSRTPFYHRSWYWWQTFRFSNLSSRWPEFVTLRNEGVNMRAWLQALPKEQQELFWCRHGKYEPPYRPSQRWIRDTKVARSFWTKGGTYSLATPLDRILVTGELGHERERSTPSQHKLTPALCHKLEKELQHFIDLDTLNAVETKWEAVNYARRRIQELLRWRKRGVSLYTTSWFFQEPIPDPSGYFYWYPERGIVIPRRNKDNWPKWVWW